MATVGVEGSYRASNVASQQRSYCEEFSYCGSPWDVALNGAPRPSVRTVRPVPSTSSKWESRRNFLFSGNIALNKSN